MQITTFLQIMLLVGGIVIALLAFAFLRTRRLSLEGYLLWGILALLVPLLGPFLVILCKPGKSRESLRRMR